MLEVLFRLGVFRSHVPLPGVPRCSIDEHDALDVTVATAPWLSVAARYKLHALLLNTIAESDCMPGGRGGVGHVEELLRSRQLLVRMVWHAWATAGVAAGQSNAAPASRGHEEDETKHNPVDVTAHGASHTTDPPEQPRDEVHTAGPVSPSVQFAFDTATGLMMSHLRLLSRMDADGAVQLLESLVQRGLAMSSPGALWPTPVPTRGPASPMHQLPHALAEQFILRFRGELAQLSLCGKTSLAQV